MDRTQGAWGRHAYASNQSDLPRPKNGNPGAAILTHGPRAMFRGRCDPTQVNAVGRLPHGDPSGPPCGGADSSVSRGWFDETIRRGRLLSPGAATARLRSGLRMPSVRPPLTYPPELRRAGGRGRGPGGPASGSPDLTGGLSRGCSSSRRDPRGASPLEDRSDRSAATAHSSPHYTNPHTIPTHCRAYRTAPSR